MVVSWAKGIFIFTQTSAGLTRLQDESAASYQHPVPPWRLSSLLCVGHAGKQ